MGELHSSSQIIASSLFYEESLWFWKISFSISFSVYCCRVLPFVYKNNVKTLLQNFFRCHYTLHSLKSKLFQRAFHSYTFFLLVFTFFTEMCHLIALPKKKNKYNGMELDTFNILLIFHRTELMPHTHPHAYPWAKCCSIFTFLYLIYICCYFID